jgi:D-alanyl-D-alanine carboxypeptidase
MFGRRGGTIAFAASSAALLTASLGLSTQVAGAQAPATTAPVGAAPKAYIVVDQATGIVLAGQNARTPLPPASLSKIMTALVAVAALPSTATVSVSDRAAAMPAHKLNMKPGQVWPVGDVLSALLASSANDAAAALAERVSGSVEAFSGALGAMATHLQMADAPVLQDPAGLDDYTSVRGGNLVSARDLAIAARAVLAEPRLAPIVARPITEFVAPDGVPHRLVNHNKLLTRYPGAIGMKTGYTRKAGRGLVAAATRNGRTEIAVILDAVDTYGWAAQLLDATFAQAAPPANGDRLPAIRPALRIKAAAPVVSAASQASPAVTAAPALVTESLSAAHSRGVPAFVSVALWAVAAASLLVVALRARVLIRRQRRRRRRRAHARVRQPAHRRPDPHLTPNHRPRREDAERFREITRRDLAGRR